MEINGLWLLLLFVLLSTEQAQTMDDPRTCLTISENMVAWYDANSLDISSNVWTNKIGNGEDGTITARTGLKVITESDNQNELYLNGQSVVVGTSASKLTFGQTNFITPDHTIFNLCKYRENGASKGRILDATTYNGLYGFWSAKSGVAHEKKWITQHATSQFGDDWVLSTTCADLYRGNGDLLTTNPTGNPIATAIGINRDELSDFACAEIIFVNERLNDGEIKCVEEYFSCKYDLGLPDADCGTGITPEYPMELLATDNACYDAKAKATDYKFSPPKNGKISGIKLVGKSGSVTCKSGWLGYAGTYFGCGNGWGNQFTPTGGLFIEMIEELPNGGTTYYPNDGTAGFTNRGDDYSGNCGANGCSIQWYSLDPFNAQATEIEFIGPSYDVTTNQVFSIQYGEGCCGDSTHDNAGIACAEVYFIYDEIVPDCPNERDSFDWATLTADGTNIPEIYTAEENIMSISEDTLSLNIYVELEYEIAATADEGDGPFGVTYVLDFEDFDAYKDNIYEPGTCQNREGNDFFIDGNNLRPFNEWWGYSDDPNIDGNIGSINTMAYPPQTNTFWTQQMSVTDECTYPGIITYNGTFTWNELVACAKTPGGTSYVETVDGPTDITLSGVFFINVVSPYAKDSNVGDGYYRVYQLLSKPFEIRISKSVYVLNEAGINVLSMSVIAVYKENALIEPQNDFRLVVLTESQNYLKLSANTAGYLFTADIGVTIEQGDFTAPTDSEQGDDCLNNKAYICSQLWVIQANGVDCNTKGIDFSGKYTLKFDTSCRDGQYNEYCVDWLDQHGEIDAGVALEAKLTWKDEICDPQVFNVQFDAEMKFFTSADYTVDGTGTPDGEGDHLFQVGKDNIYVEINTEFASGAINVFDTKLINVWICTFEPGYVTSAPDANTGTGGCFDANIDGCEGAVDETECFSDQFENPYFYHIYQGEAVPNALSLEGFDEINTDANKDILRFYFTVPHRIARDTLYVQAQVEVTLVSGGRRRVLRAAKAAQKTANQIDHFIKQTGLKHDSNPNNNPQPPQYPQQPINYPQPQAPNPSTFVINLSSPWIIGIGSLLAVILGFNIVFMCYMNCNKQQRARVSFDARRRNGYSSVKNIDSDVNDSEVNAINVVSDQSD